MTEQDKIIEDLFVITKKQSDNIEGISNAVEILVGQVASKPSKKSAFGFSVVLSFVTVFIVAVMFLQLRTTNDNISNCTNPTGECFQQNAANSAVNRGQIICNQEKVLYFVRPNDYKPLPFCVNIINAEIDRGAGGGAAPKLTVPTGTDQIPQLSETFEDKRQK